MFAGICTACSSGATAPDSSSNARSPAPQQAELPTFDPSATPDASRVEQLADEGLGEGQAVFGALTHVAVEERSPLEYRITHRYPTGNDGQMTVTLTPDRTFDPESAESLRATYAETEGEFTFRLEFFVAYDDMPEDVEQEIRGAMGHPGDAAFAVYRPTAAGAVAAETTGAGVVVQGVVTEAGKAGLSAFVDYLDRALGTKGALDKFKGALEAGMAVKDAYAVKAEHDDLMKQIDALEECAENPTNPVTRRGYQDDPAQRKRILDAIAEARTDITSNIAVMFLGMINSTASGLTGGASKVLAFVVGPVTDYVKAELGELNRRRMDELRKMITPCDGFTLQLTGTNLVNPYLESTFDLFAEVIACPVQGGEWRFSGTYTMTTHADEFSEEDTTEGWLLDVEGGQSPDAVELVLGWYPSVEQHLRGGFPEGDGTLTVTNRKRATASVYLPLDEYIGPYSLKVTSGEPGCDEAAP